MWGNGIPKVKAAVMYKSIPNGGMKLLHFKSQINALNFNWIKRLFNNSNGKWVSTFQQYISHMKVQDVFFSRCFLTFNLSNLPLFYQDIINTWKEIQLMYIPNSGTDILNEMLWHNNFITIERKPIFFKHWYDRGIKFIRDIVDNNGTFLSVEDLRTKYGINTHFLEYYSIRSAIPGHWKQQIRNDPIKIPEEFPVIYINNMSHCILHLSCNQIYWCLIDSKFKDLATGQIRWSETFEISAPDWVNIYKLPYSCTIETRLQAFQFSLLHRFVVHNSRLKTMGLTESDLCNYCPSVDTIIHRFVECDQSKTFWSRFQDWWNGIYTGENIVLSSSDIIFGLYKSKHMYALNNCILQGKYYIHARACQEFNLQFTNFLPYLTHKVKTERQVRYNQSKQNLFTKQWGLIALTLLG